MEDEINTLERNLAKTANAPAMPPQDNSLQDDEWPERCLAVTIKPAKLTVGRLAIVDCGQGGLKIELHHPIRELEAELLPPAEMQTFIEWIKEIGRRHIN